MTVSGLYIGLMSGTSADAIDAALVQFDTTGHTLVALTSCHYSDEVQRAITELMQSGSVTLDALGQLDIAIGEAFAAAANNLLKTHGVSASAIKAIGSHGQTLRHLPPSAATPYGFSMQLGDPSTIAARTGIDVIADFRRADMAQQGHGAPLAPAFHEYVFSGTLPAKTRFGVLNLGGIANLTVFADASINAWDTGPASTLMDAWTREHLGQPYDNCGQWAASGQVNDLLLQQMLTHPYFAQVPPKSTGFETFSMRWLKQQLQRQQITISNADVQASLLALTVESVAAAVNSAELESLIVCGGGVFNTYLMAQLQAALPQLAIASSSDYGVDPMAVEAMAFAWLAWRHQCGYSGNIPSVTGAKQPVILGGHYPKPL